MLHQVSNSDGILIVGAPDILAACQFAQVSPHLGAVAASVPTLHDLAASAEAIVAKHEVVLFETNVSEADLAALAQFVALAQGRTKFIALVDENLPLTKVRMLGDSGAADVLPLEIKAEALIQALADVAKVPEALEPKRARASLSGKVFSIAQ